MVRLLTNCLIVPTSKCIRQKQTGRWEKPSPLEFEQSDSERLSEINQRLVELIGEENDPDHAEGSVVLLQREADALTSLAQKIVFQKLRTADYGFASLAPSRWQ